MRHFIVWNRVLACMFFISVLLGAGEAAAFSDSDVSIEVKKKSQKDNNNGETEVETEDNLTVTDFRTETEVYTLHVTLENYGDREYQGDLQWCFISEHSSGDVYDDMPVEPVPATFSPGRKVITVPSDGALKEKIVSQPFVFERKQVETEWYTGDGDTHEYEAETGDVYKGYVVFFVVNGDIMATAGSSGRYSKEEWVQRCRKAIAGKK